MKLNIKIPASWNELSDRQLKNLAYYFHKYEEGRFLDLLVVIILMDIRWWQLRKAWRFFMLITQVDASDLKQFFPWLYESVTLTRFIPEIKTKNEVLYPPQNRLIDLVVNEFSNTEDLYLGWYHQKDPEYLRYLMAVLYRENHEGKRAYFDKTELDARAAALSKVSRKVLLATLLSYQGCREYLFTQFPVVFPKPDPNKPKKKIPRSSGFGKLVLNVAGGKFGTHNETKNTNLYVFLKEFETQLKEKK